MVAEALIGSDTPTTAARGRAPGWTAALPMAGAVFVLLIFSQGWVTLVAGPEAGPEALEADKYVQLPAYAVVLAMVAARPWATARAGLRALLPLAMVALAFLTTLWSIDPATTLRRSVALLLTTVAGIAIAARFDWRDVARSFAISHAVLTFGSLLMCVAAPSYGVMHTLFPGAWRGLWAEKNALGFEMAVSFNVCVAAAMLDRRRRRVWLATAATAAFLVVMSTSKTSLASLSVGALGLLFVALVRRGPVSAIVSSYVALVGAAGGGLWAATHTAQLLAIAGKDATLTGRTRIWDAIGRQLHDRPITGFGYAAFWTTEDKWAPLSWIKKQAQFRPYTAHNTWLDTSLSLGLGGLVLFGLLMGYLWVKSLYSAYVSRAGWLCVPLLAVVTVNMLTESLGASYNNMTWMMMVALACRLGLGVRETEPEAVES